MKRICITAALAAVLTSGCATHSGESSRTAAYYREDFRIRFMEDRSRCHAAGGRLLLQVQGGGLDRDGVPRTRTPYACH